MVINSVHGRKFGNCYCFDLGLLNIDVVALIFGTAVAAWDLLQLLKVPDGGLAW